MTVPAHQARAIAECKGVLKHAWYETTTNAKPEFGDYIALRCERCGTERLDKVGSQGQLLNGRRYIHPEGYKEIQADSMADWRVQFLADFKKRHKIK